MSSECERTIWLIKKLNLQCTCVWFNMAYMYITSEAAMTEELSHGLYTSPEVYNTWDCQSRRLGLHNYNPTKLFQQFPKFSIGQNSLLESICSTEQASGLSCHRETNYDFCISSLNICNKHLWKNSVWFKSNLSYFFPSLVSHPSNIQVHVPFETYLWCMATFYVIDYECLYL